MAMAPHTLVNYGFFYQSFHRLKPGEHLYWKKDAKRGAPITLPSSKVRPGIKFGYMDGSHETFLVRVDDLVLKLPSGVYTGASVRSAKMRMKWMSGS